MYKTAVAGRSEYVDPASKLMDDCVRNGNNKGHDGFLDLAIDLTFMVLGFISERLAMEECRVRDIIASRSSRL